MPDLFGKKQLGRAATGGRFYATPAERVEAGAVYFPVESSPLFGVAEYTVEAGHLGAFATVGTFVFDKPVDWFDLTGRKVFCRPSTGEIVNQDRKGDVLIGYQVGADVSDDKLGVFLTQGQLSMSIIVTSTADTGAGSLRQAIADANDGDVILFDDEIFPAGQTTAILLSNNIAVNKQLTIDAASTATMPGATTTPRVAIDSQNNSRCLYLQPGASGNLRGLLFCNASNSTNGGAVYCSATNPITFTQCRFSNNQGNTGGAASATGAANLTFDRCEFSGNTANSGGTVYGSDSATLTFDDCTFSGNTATTNGGALYSTKTASLNLNDCEITNCTSGSNGGGIAAVGSSQCVFNRCSITNCTTSSNGGAAYFYGSASATFVDCAESGNTSDDPTRGGIVALNTAAITVNASTFGTLCIGVTVASVFDGQSTVDTLVLLATTSAAPTITLQDGAALAVTTSATVPSGATFTSAGRAYLATATGLDFSAATLNNVVACTYGAGLESFNIDADGATWTAQDLTTPILIETRNDTGGWDTLTAQATGGAYTATFEVGTTARAFDGVTFLRAELSEYWQATAWAAATNGAGTSSGGESATDSWSVEPVTITPNLNEG